jgi:hypothetical protein
LNCVTISFVILNLFQDNMRRLFVILKQVQDDERGVGMTRKVYVQGCEGAFVQE